MGSRYLAPLRGRPALPALPSSMLINLVPDFFAILDSADPVAAYRQYFDAHRRILEAYWRNYVLDPESPDFLDIVRGAIAADRADLRAMLERVDVPALAREAEA